MESHTVPSDGTLGCAAPETCVELLSRVEPDPSSNAFYGRLCEATCRLGGMDRAVIFRYDSARRRVGAAGAYGIPLEVFAEAQVTVETIPVARHSLEQDRVIEVSDDVSKIVPEEYRGLIADSTLVVTPMAAAGRWLGVILSDRGPSRPPLSDSERALLYTLGKTAALASFARLATNKQAQARQLQERMDLAREVHESVIQRLFGIQLVFSSQAELSEAARQRIGAELQAALFDLRRALQRPLARQAPETNTTVLQEVERLRRQHRDLHLVLKPGSEAIKVPMALEPLAQSILAEAVRNARKHARPGKVEVSLAITGDDTFVLDVVNDGVRSKPRQS